MSIPVVTRRKEKEGITFFVEWKSPDELASATKRTCDKDPMFLEDVATAVMTRNMLSKSGSQPWIITLELVRETISQTDNEEMDEYFGGLANALYLRLIEQDECQVLPREIDICWPGSKYMGVYRSMAYSPRYDD